MSCNHPVWLLAPPSLWLAVSMQCCEHHDQCACRVLEPCCAPLAQGRAAQGAGWLLGGL